MYQTVFIVEEKYSDMTVERYLKDVKGMSSRTLVKLKHKVGGLTRNGEFVRSVDLLNVGDRLGLTFEDDKILTPSNDVNIDVAYEDDEYIVCNKSGDIATHPSLAYPNYTLANGVSAYLQKSGSFQTIRVINRLDKDTSGLVLIAKHQYAAALVGKLGLRKKYYAVVKGEIFDGGRIDMPISRESDLSKKRIVSEFGNRAVTNYKPVSVGKGATLLEIELETGRTHQIRVHFSNLGYPLIGDILYGTADNTIPRQALHCKNLEFFNGISEKAISVSSNFPYDFYQVLKKFEIKL